MLPTVKQLYKKYIVIKKQDCFSKNKWQCYLAIDHQSFCIADVHTKKDAVWTGQMLCIALERMIEQASDPKNWLKAKAQDE